MRAVTTYLRPQAPRSRVRSATRESSDNSAASIQKIRSASERSSRRVTAASARSGMCASDDIDATSCAALVELRLRSVEAFTVERLDSVGCTPDQALGIVRCREIGEQVVGERTRVAALRPPDADT